ncbi:MAG: hypothetical protein H7835_20400 [Magnetococcus sp. XQGC-1]
MLQAALNEFMIRSVVTKKTHFISHVMRYQGKMYGEGNCALYGVYHAQGTEEPYDECQNVQKAVSTPYGSPFLDSWHALDQLALSIRKDLDGGQFTHVVVIVMGWNTPQEEAFRNFNSIVSKTRRSANKDKNRTHGASPFNPLVVGVTWSSKWET